MSADHARSGPHQDIAVVVAGEPVSKASGALVLVHGRGASAASILSLIDVIGQPGLAYYAPQAAGFTWYPHSFLSPLEANEPYLSSALDVLHRVVDGIVADGVSAERIALLGFSQGACLSLEFVARNAQRYGGVIGLSGGLIGPDGTLRDYAGSLDGTPVFLGCSDVDFHIPADRVKESAEVLESLGAHVTMRLYPGMGHTVNEDELAYTRAIIERLAMPVNKS